MRARNVNDVVLLPPLDGCCSPAAPSAHCPLPSNRFQSSFELIIGVLRPTSTVVVQYGIKDMSGMGNNPQKMFVDLDDPQRYS